MIYTLTKIAKLTANFVNKHHDLLRVLLSWYSFLKQYDMTKKENNEYQHRVAHN